MSVQNEDNDISTCKWMLQQFDRMDKKFNDILADIRKIREEQLSRSQDRRDNLKKQGKFERTVTPIIEDKKSIYRFKTKESPSCSWRSNIVKQEEKPSWRSAERKLDNPKVQGDNMKAGKSSKQSSGIGIVNCYKCFGIGHIASQCPHGRNLIKLDSGIGEPKVAVVQTCAKEMVVAGVTNKVLKDTAEIEVKEDMAQRDNIFYSRCVIENKDFSLMVDGASNVNVANSIMVKELGLHTLKHPNPYKLQWLNECGEMKVTKQIEIDFSIGSYRDRVLCDVVPMHCAHFLLGRPWQFDRRVVHDGYRNSYTFMKDGRKVILEPLTPKEVAKDQTRVRKAIEASKKVKMKNIKVEQGKKSLGSVRVDSNEDIVSSLLLANYKDSRANLPQEGKNDMDSRTNPFQGREDDTIQVGLIRCAKLGSKINVKCKGSKCKKLEECGPKMNETRNNVLRVKDRNHGGQPNRHGAGKDQVQGREIVSRGRDSKARGQDIVARGQDKYSRGWNMLSRGRDSGTRGRDCHLRDTRCRGFMGPCWIFSRGRMPYSRGRDMWLGDVTDRPD